MSSEGRPTSSRPGNQWVTVSFVLGFLTGLYGTLTGMSYFTAGWPAHGPVGVVGALIVMFSLLTILGSFLILLSKRARTVGAILVLVFGIMANAQGFYTIWSFFTRLLMPVLSFAAALYAVIRDWKSSRGSSTHAQS